MPETGLSFTSSTKTVYVDAETLMINSLSNVTLSASTIEYTQPPNQKWPVGVYIPNVIDGNDSGEMDFNA